MEIATIAQFTCKSVLGGWQTEFNGILIGPIFNKSTDLWTWQRTELFATSAIRW